MTEQELKAVEASRRAIATLERRAIQLQAAAAAYSEVGMKVAAEAANIRSAINSWVASMDDGGFFHNLTPEQQKAALEYHGPENHGSAPAHDE